MRMQTKSPRRRRGHTAFAATFALVALAFAAGCAPVRLTAAYDPQVDQTATLLQKELDRFLTRFEMLAPEEPERRYLANRDFYLDYAVELRSLQLRVASHPDNQRSERQVELMAENLELLRKHHEEHDDISPVAARTYRELFQTGWKAIITYELAKRRN